MPAPSLKTLAQVCHQIGVSLGESLDTEPAVIAARVQLQDAPGILSLLYTEGVAMVIMEYEMMDALRICRVSVMNLFNEARLLWKQDKDQKQPSVASMNPSVASMNPSVAQA